MIIKNIWNNHIAVIVVLLLLACPGFTAVAAENSATGYEDVPEFGGPGSVGVVLKDDATESSQFSGFKDALQSYDAFKERVNKEHGFAFSFDYTAMYLHANKSLAEEDAAGGIFRFYGSWTLLGRDTGNTGSIIYKIENRHRLGTNIPPKGLGFASGYAGLYAPIYADYGFGLTNLYWQQKFKENRFNFVAGIVDSTDYLDIYGLINPWTSFSNLAFLTNPTIPVPNQGIGAAFGWMASDNIYIVGGLADTNGDPSKPGKMFDSFISDNEYFTHLEVGWVSSFDRRYFDNIHLAAWHADKRTASMTPSGWGLSFSYTTFINDEWMPFVRAGYAEDGGALYSRTISAGLGRYWGKTRNLLGVGLNWSRPDKWNFGPGLDDQYTMEMFYRWQITPNFALTPDFQVVRDPALHPTENTLYVYGLRARFAL